MRKEQKSCIDCGKIGVKERNRCESCVKVYNRQRAKEHDNRKIANLPTAECIVCGKPIKLWRQSQNPETNKHTNCKWGSSHDDNGVQTGRYEARKIAAEMGYVTDKHYVVHHIDENPMNNNPNNLWYMSSQAHNSLHTYLRRHRSLWLKNQSKYDENCWETLRDHLTTAWLETTSAKVIKLGDIGQSAAEPLNDEMSQEEGSEAMYVDPKD